MSIHEGIDLIEAEMSDYTVVSERRRLTWKEVRYIYLQPLWVLAKRASAWTAVASVKVGKLALRASKYLPDVFIVAMLAIMVQTFMNMENEVRGAEDWIGAASAGLTFLSLLAGFFWALGALERRVNAKNQGQATPVAQSAAGAAILALVASGFAGAFMFYLAGENPVFVGRLFAGVLGVTVAVGYLSVRRHVVTGYRILKAKRAATRPA